MSAKPRRMDARSEDPVSRCSSAPPVSWQALWRLLAHMRHSVFVDPTGSFFKDISLCWLHRVGSWCKILKQQKSTWAHGFFGPPRSRTVATAGLLRTFSWPRAIVQAGLQQIHPIARRFVCLSLALILLAVLFVVAHVAQLAARRNRRSAQEKWQGLGKIAFVQSSSRAQSHKRPQRRGINHWLETD